MSWGTVKLGDFLQVRDDRFKPNGSAIEGLKRVDKIDFSGQLHLSNSPSKTDMILIKSGDLLISGINVYKGAVAVYEGEEDITATIHYSSYEYDKKKIDVEFLKLFLKSPEFLDAIKEQVPGGIKTEIKPKHFLPLEVVIPDLKGQREVLESFSKVESTQNTLTAELTRQLNLVKQLRQAFLREAMQGKLVPQDPKDGPASELLQKIKAALRQAQDDKKGKKQKELPPVKEKEIPFEIPENWVWCRLGEIANIVRGGSPRPAGDKRFYDGDIPFLKVADLTNDADTYLNTHTYSIKAAGLHKTRFVEASTLLLTNSGATLGVPKICMFPTAFNDGIAAFLSLNHIDKVFLYFFLKSKSEWFLKEASRGQGQPNLNIDIISSTLFALPPLPEQHRIVAKLEQLMQHCDELEQSIRQSKEQTNMLLQAALREALKGKGKIGVVEGK